MGTVTNLADWKAAHKPKPQFVASCECGILLTEDNAVWWNEDDGTGCCVQCDLAKLDDDTIGCTPA